jgi:hypothetical protein
MGGNRSVGYILYLWEKGKGGGGAYSNVEKDFFTCICSA